MKKLLIYILGLLMSLQPLSAGAREVSPFAHLLVWQASEESSAFWANVTSEPVSNTLIFSPKNVNFEWDRGFRAGFLYEPECYFWDTKLYWTYYPTNKNMNVPLGAELVTPEFFSGFLSQDVTKLQGIYLGANLNWQLIMNTIDLEASHKVILGKSLIIRPSIGIKGASINQTIHANWNALVYVATEKVENNFLGAGPSFGIAGDWNLYGPLNLIGNFSTAFLWGRWNVNDTYKRPSALFGLVTPTTINTSMKRSMFGTLMLDYFVGLEWRHSGRSHVTLQLGYEMQYWANQLRLPTFQQLPLHGDLTLQGGTCGIYVDL